ncbi:MAG: hypothetical protein ACE5DM_04945, partial [Candidatus Nanoarchaeia archaeon]
ASAAVFCENNLGNFFAEGLTVPSDDCGLLNITDPANDIYLPADTTTLTLKQHDAAETVFYEVRWKTNVNPYNLAFSTDRISTQNGTSASIAWDTSALPGDQYTINITPYANSSMFGVIKEARSFQRTEDINTSDFDADGFDDVALGGTDCNDLDNSTNPSATEQCGTTNDRRTDYNCNNKPGWGDADCSPPDFDPGTFNYVNENSRNGTTDWNALNSIQTATVSYLTLNNSYGRVVFSGNIDLDGLNLTYVDISDGSIDVDSVNMQTLNRSAELIFYKTFENKTANPVALRNGQVCGSYCTDPVVTNGTVTFNVTSFTNYSASTNSQLTIYDEGDPLGGNKTLEKLHQIRFFANYSKITDDTPINNRTVEAASVDHRGRCNISLRFENGTTIFADQKMGYSEFYGRYDYTANPFNFTTAGTYTYNITCTAENFATLFGEDTLSVTIDTTSPIAPILYPQIVLHPTNTTTDNHTMVCGYFNESYINISGSVLQGIYTYDFGGFTNYSEQDSYYGGAGITTTFNSLAGQNVTFVNWSAEVETLFNSFAYIEYLNHDRTCFIRYNISRVNRTGNELRIELTEALQDDVPIGTRISLFDSSRPAGWFNQSVSLFTGANKIAIWGDDLSGNSGPASEDSINSPYAAVVPPKPILWPLTSVVNGNFSVLGIVNRLVLSTTNISLVVLNNSNYSVQYHNSSVFTLTTTVANATVVQPASENDDFIYINGSDEVFFKNTSRFIGFANHNRTHWYHYSISNYTNPLPGEDLRIYLSPNLTSAVPNLTTVFLYNNSVPQGWFNATLDEANMWANKTHEFYVVATDANGESPKSDTYFIFYDIDDPEFMPGST